MTRCGGGSVRDVCVCGDRVWLVIVCGCGGSCLIWL